MDPTTTTSNQESIENLESNLINQFNCLGTTDKEELVKQLIKLVGPSLGQEGASFFLDMNNW
jgi:hypothetical protein